MSLEETAQKRKERLAALRQQASASQPHDEHENASTASKRPAPDALDGDDARQEQKEEKQTIRFRNYQPLSEDLQNHKSAPAPIGPDAKELIPTVEGEAEKVKEQTLQEAASKPQDLDLSSLAPKKPNWDLKRDLAKRLEKLERATESVIADLIRERLRQDKDIAHAADAAEMEHHMAMRSNQSAHSNENNSTNVDEDDD